MRAKLFVGNTGGVTERKMAVDVSEELARKGQELREMAKESRFAQGRRRHHGHGDPAPRAVGNGGGTGRRRRGWRSRAGGRLSRLIIAGRRKCDLGASATSTSSARRRGSRTAGRRPTAAPVPPRRIRCRASPV